MTKSMVITFKEADENLLVSLVKKLKIKTKAIETETEEYVEQSKAEILEGLRRGIEEMKAIERGEMKSISWDEMVDEVRAEVKLHHPDYKFKQKKTKLKPAGKVLENEF